MIKKMLLDEQIKKEYRELLSRCEKEKITPNFFSRYALTERVSDPSSKPRSDLNDAEIEHRIKEISSYWNNLINNAKFKNIIKTLKAEFNNSRDTIIDPVKRKKYLSQIEIENLSLINNEFSELDNHLKLLNNKGFITPEEVIELKNSFKLLSPKAIDEHLLERKVLIKSKPEEIKTEFFQEFPTLDSSIVKGIQSDIRLLGYNDLFSFLDLPKKANNSVFLEKCDRIKNEWKNKPLNPQKDAVKKITQFVKTHFSDPKSVQKYQNTLLQIEMDNDNLIERGIKDAKDKGTLQKSVLEYLTRNCIEKGIDEKFAFHYIIHKAIERGIRVETFTFDGDYIRCPRCFTPNPSAEKVCKNCGTSLFKLCPKCNAEILFTSEICSFCGVAIKDYYAAQYFIQEADELIEQGKLFEAKSKINSIFQYLGSDKSIDRLNNLLQEKQKEINSLFSLYKKSLFEKNLYRAKDTLIKIKDYYGGFAPDGQPIDEYLTPLLHEIKKIEERVNQGDELLKKGEMEDAVQIFYSTLNKCSDCVRALEGIKKCPPSPPFNVSIKYSTNTCELKWDKSHSYGNLFYHIIRKEGNFPESINDGIKISRTQNLSFIDKTVVVGHIYYYSFFTERETIISLKGAEHPPILIKDDVKSFTLFPGNNIVKGRWRMPGDAKELIILKKQDSPPRSMKESEIIQYSGTTFVDRNVKNGVKYYYRIFCRFQNEKGKTEYSKGITGIVIPNIPPPPITDMVVLQKKSGNIIRWTPTEKGTVNIYKSPTPPKYPEKTIRPVSNLGELGVLVGSSTTNTLTDNKKTNYGIVYYIPVTVNGHIGVIGKACKVADFEDISNLVGEDQGDYISLKWNWPEGCTQVIVTWRYDQFPSSSEDLQIIGSEKVSKGQYNKKGCFELKQISPAYFFKLYALYWVDGELLPSSGVEPSSGIKIVDKIIIKYEIQKPTRGNDIVFILDSSMDIASLPEMILIAKPGKLPPIELNDGTECCKIKNITINSDNPYSVSIKLNNVQKPCYLKAFFSDENQYSFYQILPNNPSKMIIE
ncbi:double zinc ribbon domain-containing protein [Methanospirillum sp.]